MTEHARPERPEGGGGSVTTAFLARLATRTRLRRWSRTRTIAVLLAVAGLIGLLAWVVLGSSLLTVRTVEVSGVDGALGEQVRAAAEAEVGTPLARVDIDALEGQIEQLRGVGVVKVQRDWPRALSVEVALRPRVAVVRTASGYDVVDGEGVPISSTTARPKGLPLVTVGTGPGATLADGLTVLESAPPKVAARTDVVLVRSAQDVRLKLKNGDEVRWGSTTDAARKAAVLTALLKQPAAVYDVRAPELPTTRR